MQYLVAYSDDFLTYLVKPDVASKISKELKKYEKV